jgi:hypothetical protein
MMLSLRGSISEGIAIEEVGEAMFTLGYMVGGQAGGKVSRRVAS